MNPSFQPPHGGVMKNVNNTFMLSDDAVRFQVELEFVQCLANPNYLNFLAQRDFFKDATFVNYLQYLLYWKRPEYVKYLRYPQCLHMLELLQHKQFRDELVNTPCAKFIEDQMLLHWQYYTRKRVRMQQTMMDTVRQRQPTAAAKSIGVAGNEPAPPGPMPISKS